MAESRPVACCAVVIAGENEVSVDVGLCHETADANLVEDLSLRPREVLFTELVLYGATHDISQCPRVGVPVSAHSVGGILGVSADRELKDVDRRGITKTVVWLPRYVRGSHLLTRRPATAEPQTTRHTEEVDDPDLCSRIVWCILPLR